MLYSTADVPSPSLIALWSYSAAEVGGILSMYQLIWSIIRILICFVYLHCTNFSFLSFSSQGSAPRGKASHLGETHLL